jgi:hypothetical protein
MREDKGGAADGTKAGRRKTIVGSIFLTHMRRIGIPRTFLGGGLMYVSFLEFVFIHLTSIIILYRLLLSPVFKLRKFRIKDYIILDRGRIEGMTLLDRINCEFCGYANGTTRLWNAELDELAGTGLGKGRILAKAVVGLYALCLAVFSVFSFIFSKILFAIIALFLGYHWASTKETRLRLRETGYGNAHNPVMRLLIRFAKVYAETLATNLEQIESSWCPLKHVETATTVVPGHHANFLGRDELPAVLEVLAKDGTVSPRKPKY